MELLGLLTLQSLCTLIPHAITLLITYVSAVLIVNYAPFAHVEIRGFCFLDIAWFSIHYEAAQGLCSQNCRVRTLASTLPR